jgi:hypothetical protein
VSRKREHQRETKKELARQLGVAAHDVPEQLLHNERVTEPEVTAACVVEQWPTPGFFARFGFGTPRLHTLRVHSALWCVSNGGARLVRSARWRGVLTAAGAVTLVDDGADVHGNDVVRYRRPGFFVLASMLTVDRTDDDAVLDHTAFTSVGTLDVEGASRPLTALGSYTSTTKSRLTSVPAWSVHVTAIPAADRVKQVVTSTTTSPDGFVRTALSLTVRL